mmetsp:Transcript_95494/g.247299  ORF Transcript_95494/g.247299 Transcript_95494/m.247299 type:complete len:248 (-) Transcript_95494:40-783(-)
MRERGLVGSLSMAPPNCLQISSAALAVPSSSLLSSQSCQALRASTPRWSAIFAFCARTKPSSRTRASLNSCQYTLRTASSPMARSSHCAFKVCRWSRNTALSSSSVKGNLAPPGTARPAASSRSTEVAVSRNSSARAPQDVCCTVSQAALMFRILPSFVAVASCRSNCTHEKQPRGCPATDFGLAKQVDATSCRRPSMAVRKSRGFVGGGSVVQLRCLKKWSSPRRASRAAWPCSPACTGACNAFSR